jgi:hypothetical protein
MLTRYTVGSCAAAAYSFPAASSGREEDILE